MAYNGGTSARTAANFTPVASYSGLSADLRRKLTETKITPAAETPAAAPQVKPSSVTPRSGTNRRAQVER
jgi:hypothetical protein